VVSHDSALISRCSARVTLEHGRPGAARREEVPA
jgi:hypothetical protein